MNIAKAEILLVEDDHAEARLAREALAEAALEHNLHTASDGVEALDFLRRRGKFAKMPRPDLVLLDLNLPRKDGREVLREIKQDQDLRRIPVIVLTTSKSAEDIATAYDLQANCYIAKPVDMDGFVHVVRALHDFWLKLAQLPLM